MDSRILLLVLSFAVLVQSECKIHEQEFIFYNISDLGIAALDNDLDAVDDLISKVVYPQFIFCNDKEINLEMCIIYNNKKSETKGINHV